MKQHPVVGLIAALFGLVVMAAGALLLTPRGIHVETTPLGQVYW